MIKNRQKGVVLFFSLIALVAMSLAAVALIRSVDTNSMISGNLGFKQSTMYSSDAGINTAMTWLNANPTLLNNNSAANGYFASSAIPSTAQAFVDANGVGDTTDSQGNTIRYVVNRMCNAAGAPNPPVVTCLRGPVSTMQNDNGLATQTLGSPQPTIIYRITARVTGPKNTVSYVQTFVY
ncbi:MAG TPA: hypothetical protein PL131_07420 [Methylotenera sp.]|nr:hypothetical protein [Methylotenera sp.]HPH05690.1 hypothetical protein [Methylotenera sp.]